MIVDPGIALYFVDEPAADVSMGFMTPEPSPERDLIMSPQVSTVSTRKSTRSGLSVCEAQS
jgi:hypothetical protein